MRMPEGELFVMNFCRNVERPVYCPPRFEGLRPYCKCSPEIHECFHHYRMRTPRKKLTGYMSTRYSANDRNSRTFSIPKNQNSSKLSINTRWYLKPGYRKRNTYCGNNILNSKPIENIQKPDCSLGKCIRSFKQTGKRTCFTVRKNSRNSTGSSQKESIRRRRLKRKNASIEQDEVSSMQRKAKYLLIKMKLEQNLIDAYLGDGWKGQSSREKIKPVKELQRAQRQIIKCKLGIRDLIHHLDVLGSEGRIEDSLMHPDGSVFHEYIFCAKCKLLEAFLDNDIILCDGNCNCGFHQKCLDPPLEKIPPGDQGWLCRICNCKMEILETINAHLGTSFTVNNSSEEIFKEAVVSPGSEVVCPNLVEDWPSDDSEDEDYCPDSTSNIAEFEENFSRDASCSSDSVFSLDASLSCLGSGESSDEITNYCRQRRDVNYRKLYCEMFGKEPNEREEQSEDEDWGPSRKKKTRITSDISIASPDGEGKDIHEKMALPAKISCNKRSFYRIRPNAIQMLHQFFAENELPSRSAKIEFSKELGISVEKVDKWFKNQRYASIKIRKEDVTNHPHRGSGVSIGNEGHRLILDDVSSDSSSLLPLASIFHLPHHLKMRHRGENLTSAKSPPRQQKGAKTIVRSTAFQVESEFRNGIFLKKHVNATVRNPLSMKTTPNVPDTEQLYVDEMQMLWALERRLHRLKQRLLACKDDNEVQVKNLSREGTVVYVPVAELIEKAA